MKARLTAFLNNKNSYKPIVHYLKQIVQSHRQQVKEVSHYW